MAHYIDKDALVAEIKRLTRKNEVYLDDNASDTVRFQKTGAYSVLNDVLSFIDTLEVKDVGISIPNIDDTLKEEGLDPDSKEAKVFKESYYMGLEKFKAQKGE